jgi:hypothetical protein
MWIKLKEHLIHANEHAHPRFKMMGENPTIPIARVLEIMEKSESEEESKK